MVYELCERGAVLDLNSDPVKPLSEEESRKIFVQLILGMEYRMC